MSGTESQGIKAVVTAEGAIFEIGASIEEGAVVETGDVSPVGEFIVDEILVEGDVTEETAEAAEEDE